MLVNKETSNDSRDRKDRQAVREYSHAQELINNLPYIAMIVLGVAVFVVGFGSSAWGWIGAGVYLIYGVASAFWIMIFVCPECRYWDTRSCPCGYGHIAARLREKKAVDCFDDKFKKHIPVIVPLWFIPILAGAAVILRSFSWLLLVLLVVFAVAAFAVLPLFSAKHGCKECPQRDSCPWMKRKAKPAGALSDCQRS